MEEKTVRISTSISQEMLIALTTMAIRQGKSRSELITEILTNAVMQDR